MPRWYRAITAMIANLPRKVGQRLGIRGRDADNGPETLDTVQDEMIRNTDDPHRDEAPRDQIGGPTTVSHTEMVRSFPFPISYTEAGYFSPLIS